MKLRQYKVLIINIIRKNTIAVENELCNIRKFHVVVPYFQKVNSQNKVFELKKSDPGKMH